MSRRGRARARRPSLSTSLRLSLGTLAHERRARLGLRPRHDRRRTARCSTPGSPRPQLGRAARRASTRTSRPAELEPLAGADARRDVRVDFVTVEIDLDAAPASTPDAYLRLHLLSHLLVAPEHDQPRRDLRAPADRRLDQRRARCIPTTSTRLRPSLQRAGISVHGIDKFPRLLDYVAPDRVRIADASRVRLGAHLSPGTTVHARGLRQLQRRHPRHLDGRGPHLAGRRRRRRLATSAAAPRSWARSPAAARSASSIGARALLGANAGIGISIGDDSRRRGRAST